VERMKIAVVFRGMEFFVHVRQCEKNENCNGL
jgi:hypothetical protein